MNDHINKGTPIQSFKACEFSSDITTNNSLQIYFLIFQETVKTKNPPKHRPKVPKNSSISEVTGIMSQK